LSKHGYLRQYINMGIDQGLNVNTCGGKAKHKPEYWC
jgi:hypothetical protein